MRESPSIPGGYRPLNLIHTYIHMSHGTYKSRTQPRKHAHMHAQYTHIYIYITIYIYI